MSDTWACRPFRGLARGRRAALWANAGILTGNTLYFALSALGVGTILIASHEVFAVIKYVGAAYLVYLGVQMFRGRGIGLHLDEKAGSSADGWRMLARGFLLQTANAKSLLFFVALLPQFVDTRGPLAVQILVLAITSLAIEFAVLAGYGYFAGRASQLAAHSRFVTVANRLSGGMLMTAGSAVALARD